MELIAVDATGNGSSAEAGDLLLIDDNRTGYPELQFPAGGTAAFEMFVYPTKSSDAEAGKIEISIQLGDEWETVAIDHLHPARRR
jgi:hypothetical protein